MPVSSGRPPGKPYQGMRAAGGAADIIRAMAPSKRSTSETRVGLPRDSAPPKTREAILRAATSVFARHGYDGGSVEKISRQARSHDRMIYYYFGSKEGLFVAVLDDIYRRMDEAECRIGLDFGEPVHALATLIRFKLGYYRRHPEFVTLLNTENLHRGRHLSKSRGTSEFAASTLGTLARILASGVEQGRFRPGLAARDLYLLIVSAGYFVTSNRFTMSAFLGEDLQGDAAAARWEAFVVDAVMRVVS